MAELVSDDALQLIAAQMIDRALGDSDDGIARGESRSEGVDARLVRKQIHRRRRGARRDGHLLHHVQQFALVRVMRILRNQLSAQRLRDHLATPRKGHDLVHAAPQDHEADAGAHRGKCAPIQRLHQRRAVPQLLAVDVAEYDHDQEICQDDQAEHRKAEKDDQ